MRQDTLNKEIEKILKKKSISMKVFYNKEKMIWNMLNKISYKKKKQ